MATSFSLLQSVCWHSNNTIHSSILYIKNKSGTAMTQLLKYYAYYLVKMNISKVTCENSIAQECNTVTRYSKFCTSGLIYLQTLCTWRDKKENEHCSMWSLPKFSLFWVLLPLKKPH